RFEDVGETMVCYKNAEFDPDRGSQDSLVTVRWDDPTLHRSSVSMTGVSGDNEWPDFPPGPPDPYQYYVVEDEDHWAFANTGLSTGPASGVYFTPLGLFGWVLGFETATNVDSHECPLDGPPLHRTAAAWSYPPNHAPHAAAAMGSYQKGGTVFTV